MSFLCYLFVYHPLCRRIQAPEGEGDVEVLKILGGTFMLGFRYSDVMDIGDDASYGTLTTIEGALRGILC